MTRTTKSADSKTLEVSEYISAALLKASGIRYLGTAPDSGERVELLFDNTQNKAQAILDQHRNGGLPVNSAAFAYALREIKDLIFSARRRANAR